MPGVYALGDVANTLDGDGTPFPQLGLGGAAGRPVRGRQHRRRRRREGAPAVPLPGQGDHGDDRPQRRDRRGRTASPRAPRLPGVHVVARRARLAPQRLPRPRRARSARGRGTTWRASGRRPTSTGRTPPRSTGTRSAMAADRATRGKRRFRGEPAVELTAGDLTAVFTPGIGMTGVSLRYRGAEYLALPGGLDALRSGRTGGLPLLAPWANRLRGRRYRAAGVTVPLDGLDLPVDDHGLPIHGFLVGAPGWSVDRLSTRGDTARLRASIAVDAPAFPFPHRIEVTAIVREPTLRIDTTIVPTGRRGVPIAFGWHPYLRLPVRAAPRRGGSGCRCAGISRSTTSASRPVTRGPEPAEADGDRPAHVRRRLRARPRPPPRDRVRGRALARAARSRQLPVRPGVGPDRAAVRRARAHDRTDERAGRPATPPSSAPATRSPHPSP